MKKAADSRISSLRQLSPRYGYTPISQRYARGSDGSNRLPLNYDLAIDNTPRPGTVRMSRPPKVYNQLDQLGVEAFCDLLIEGRSLRRIAKDLGISAAALLKWLDREPGRMRQYQIARQAQADNLVDTLVELADEPVPLGPDGRFDAAAVNDKRLRIDTRKWIASKFRPGMYGDKVDVTANVNLATLTPDQVMGRIVDLLATHGLRVTTVEEGVELGEGGDKQLPSRVLEQLSN